jgi:hypothetical protein
VHTAVPEYFYEFAENGITQEKGRKRTLAHEQSRKRQRTIKKGFSRGWGEQVILIRAGSEHHTRPVS